MPYQCLPSPQDVSPRLQQRRQWDPILLMVHRLTLNGWPDRQGHVPRAARFYWSFWDELSINGDLLTKGEQVVIPPSCRDNIMADLHGSHAHINKAMDLARTCVYWPGMEADVTDYIKWCLTCIECSNLPVEMLQPHKVPPGPWVKIGVDFFQDHLGKKHLIVAASSRTCFQWCPHIISRPSLTWGNSLQLKVYLLSSCLTTDLPSTEKNLGSFSMTLTSCTPHHHPISISQMDSSRQWWRKSKMPTRKWTDPPMLRLEHYSSYMTHLSWQTSHSQQRFYMVIQLKAVSFQDHPRESIYIRSGKD